MAGTSRGVAGFERRLWRRLTLAAAILAFGATGLRAADWEEGGGARWQTLLAKARQDGQLVVAGCNGQSAELAASFKRDTGIDMTFIVGQTPQVDSRFRLEMQSGRMTIDLRFGTPADLDLAKAGLFADLHEFFVLPDASNLDNWTDRRLLWVDNAQRYILQVGQFVGSQPLVNPAFLDVARFQTLDDLMRPEFKGKIAFSDPTNPGPGQTAAAYIASIKGVDFVKNLFATQEVVFSRDVRQLTEWVARGIHPIAYGADTSEARTMRRDLPALQSVALKDAPGSLSGGCAVIAIPKGGPHPAAATVFLNWYMSRNGQEAYVRGGQQPSRRIDISRTGVFADTIPVPGANYLDQYREDWYTAVRPGLQAELRKALDK